MKRQFGQARSSFLRPLSRTRIYWSFPCNNPLFAISSGCRTTAGKSRGGSPPKTIRTRTTEFRCSGVGFIGTTGGLAVAVGGAEFPGEDSASDCSDLRHEESVTAKARRINSHGDFIGQGKICRMLR